MRINGLEELTTIHFIPRVVAESHSVAVLFQRVALSVVAAGKVIQIAATASYNEYYFPTICLRTITVHCVFSRILRRTLILQCFHLKHPYTISHNDCISKRTII